MAKTKTAKKKQDADDLIGIDLIFDFLNGDLSHSTLLELAIHYGFPMRKKEPESIWIANSEKIKKWFRERDLTPGTVNKNALRKYEMKELRASGKAKLFKKTIRGMVLIADFFRLTPHAVFEFWRDYEECPIRKTENGELETDADAFQIFLENLGIKIGPEISPAREAEDGWRHGR